MKRSRFLLLASMVLAGVAGCVGAPQQPPSQPAKPAGVEVVWLGQAAFKITSPGGKVTAVRAEHSSIYVRRNPATQKDETHPGGEAIGWIIELENGFRIYHAGDTAVFGDMKLIGERYKPDLALVPIGGHFTMDPADAAWAVKDLVRPRAVIPMHYGANPLTRGTARQFSEAMGATSPVRVLVATPGEPLRF